VLRHKRASRWRVPKSNCRACVSGEIVPQERNAGCLNFVPTNAIRNCGDDERSPRSEAENAADALATNAAAGLFKLDPADEVALDRTGGRIEQETPAVLSDNPAGFVFLIIAEHEAAVLGDPRYDAAKPQFRREVEHGCGVGGVMAEEQLLH
jgi:hypothetical protein